jgi:hypothetical protein
MLSSRRIAAVLTAIGALAVAAPVAGASAATAPSQPTAQDPFTIGLTAAQQGFAAGADAAQSGFAAGAAAAQSGATLLSQTWSNALGVLGFPSRPYHITGPSLPVQ